MTTFYAHSGNLAGQPELLCEHLLAVATRAKEFAEHFDRGEAARVAGLLHDLGKYADQFRLRLESPKSVPGKDHWTAGAAVLLRLYKHRGIASALTVEGHHTGLPSIPADCPDYSRRLADVLKSPNQSTTDNDIEKLFKRWCSDGMPVDDLKTELPRVSAVGEAASMLDIRMLFSALVDADFLETEAHFKGDDKQPRRPRPDGPQLSVSAALEAVMKRVEELTRSAEIANDVQKHRQALWDHCRRAAQRDTGLFTLTAPTGLGKTLSALGFALRHAVKNKLRRVVLVMPYLNIIDQTLQEYIKCFNSAAGFPVHFVMEDHSLAPDWHESPRGESSVMDGVSEDERTRHLLAENWDAPIILTTQVKCLESLMAHRPGQCRKLHRLARSVIIFDEIQTLPPKLTVPTLATLARLADPEGPYKSTVVFATATQPAFDHLDQHVQELNTVGWKPYEIVHDSEPMFSIAAERVDVRWRHDTTMSLDELADELAAREADSFLCILNLKRHAARLFELLCERLGRPLAHLSTAMCPSHRRQLIEQLKSSECLSLVATQCVEAGVDLDFPVVYRAFAPLDSIAQAAGRCNRHGKPVPGHVTVIDPDDGGYSKYPPGYKEAVQATRTFLRKLQVEHGCLDSLEIINCPSRLRQYFRTLYDLTGRGAGVRDDERELREAIEGGDFAEVSRLYRLIEGDTINILVPYDRDTFQALVEEMDPDKPRTLASVRRWISRARHLTVGLHRPHCDSPVWQHLNPIQFSRRDTRSNETSTWFYALPELKYHPDLGLRLPAEGLGIV